MLHPIGRCPMPAFPPITPPGHLAFPSALCHCSLGPNTFFSLCRRCSLHNQLILWEAGEATSSLAAVFANSAQKELSQSAQPHIPHPAAESSRLCPTWLCHASPGTCCSFQLEQFTKPLLQEPQCTFKTSPMTSPFSWVLHSSSLANWSSSIEIFPCRISIFSSEHFWQQRWD